MKKLRKKIRNGINLSQLILLSFVFLSALFFFSYTLNVQFQSQTTGFEKLGPLPLELVQEETPPIITEKPLDISKDYGLKEKSIIIPPRCEIKKTKDSTTIITSPDGVNPVTIGGIVYEKVKGSYTLDSKGVLKEAELTTTDYTGLIFGENDEIGVPANLKVIYKGGVVTIEGAKDKYYTLYYKGYRFSTLEKFEIKGSNLKGNFVFYDNNINIAVWGEVYWKRTKDFKIAVEYPEFGEITLIENGYKIGKGTSVNVNNNVKVSGYRDVVKNGDSLAEVNLYLDGKKHEGNYVSINLQDKTLLSNSQEEGSLVKFGWMNNYFSKPSSNTFYPPQIYNAENSFVEVRNREKEGLISEVKIIHNPDKNAVVKVYNGGNDIHSSFQVGDYRMSIPSTFSAESTPMSIIIQDSKGKNLIGTEEKPMKIVVTGFDEIASIPLGEQEATTKKYGPISERLFYSKQQYTKQNIKELYPNININGEPSNKEVKNLINTLNQLTPEMRDDLKDITFEKGKAGFKFFGIAVPFLIAEGTANPFTDEISLSSGTSASTEFHETGHVHHFNIQREDDQNLVQTKNSITNSIANKLNGFLYANNLEFTKSAQNFFTVTENQIIFNPPSIMDLKSDSGFTNWAEISRKLDFFKKEELAPFIEENQKKLSIVSENRFDEKWKKISEVPYGSLVASGGIIESIIPYLRKPEWKPEEKTNEVLFSSFNLPKAGFVRAYGNFNIWEDVATFVELLYSDPTQFRDLIDPKSSSYDKRYLEKINLLKENRFISDEIYKEATGK